MFKNMKIAITPEQPLDEVVRELERLGYKTIHQTSCNPVHNWVVADHDGIYLGWFDAGDLCDKHYPLTALTQLKEL